MTQMMGTSMALSVAIFFSFRLDAKSGLWFIKVYYHNYHIVSYNYF